MKNIKNVKNKKALFALLLVAVLGCVSGTMAYFTSTETFENIFKTKLYSVEVVETFESPEDWVPGVTTEKKVVATNKGDVDTAVRISYTESWLDAVGNQLDLTDDNGVSAAIINFAADLDSKWTKSTENGKDYYYYKTKLSKNASTSSFIESVTFNPNVSISALSECVSDSINHVKTCTTTSQGYAGGTYKLDITVETAQFDKYDTIWNTTVAIN